MENIINNPGLQHITELTLFNLDFKDLQTCRFLNKSFSDVLANPLFWLRKWRMQRGLSKENYNDWVKAIQLTKNTDVEANVRLYLEKVIKFGHNVDAPCFIDSDTVEKSTEYTFESALDERNLGVLQILASMKNNPNVTRDYTYPYGTPAIAIAARDGHLNIIKILAPITKNPNRGNIYGVTPIHFAAVRGYIDILKILVSYTDDPNVPNYLGQTPIFCAAENGNIDVLNVLAPLTKNPNRRTNGKVSPIQTAQSHGHHEFARILKTYVNA